MDSDGGSASLDNGDVGFVTARRLPSLQQQENEGTWPSCTESTESTEHAGAVLTMASTEEALRQGIRFGNRRFRMRTTTQRKTVLLEIKADTQESVLEPLTQQQLRLFVALLHGRRRAALLPGASACVSRTRLLHAAGGLDEKKIVTDRDIDARTREVDLPNYLRGPLRQLRHRLQPYGVYVYQLGGTAGRAAGYQLVFQEELRFVDDRSDPWEIDDDAQLPLRVAG